MKRTIGVAFVLLACVSRAVAGAGDAGEAPAQTVPAISGTHLAPKEKPSSANSDAAATPAERPAPSSNPRRASGGVAILASSQSAKLVVAGAISNAKKIDLHGWSADLLVDQVLAGKAGLHQTVPIAWEELSASRRPRFANGERVLVVLAPLPTQSLWRQRFPDAAARDKTLVVAANGDAFVLSPDGATLGALEHYLAMTPSARDSAPGQERLAELVSSGHASIAMEALEKLEAISGPPATDAASTLLEAAADSQRPPALRARALALAARRDTPAVRAAAKTLSEPPSPIRGAAYAVLADLEGGMPPERVTLLLAADEPDLRIAAVRQMTGDDARQRLVKVVHDDKSGPVRIVAASELLHRFGAPAIPEVVFCLDDADARVRANVAASIGALGSVAVAPLRDVVDKGSEQAAMAAVLGLSRAGKDGGLALAAIAQDHPNEKLRAFAKLAVGKGLGEQEMPQRESAKPTP